MVLRTISSRHRSVMLLLLKSLVIPSVEYCCPVWSPSHQKNIIKIEKVQSQFTKRIRGLFDLHYWDRLSSLNLFSLQRRRERYVILYIWKIIQGLVPNPGINYAPTNTGIGFTLVLPRLKGSGHVKRLREQSLTYHGVRLYKSLPIHLQHCLRDSTNKPITVATFKHHLDSYLHTLPDEPYSPCRIRRAPTNSILHQKQYQHRLSLTILRPNKPLGHITCSCALLVLPVDSKKGLVCYIFVHAHF